MEVTTSNELIKVFIVLSSSLLGLTYILMIQNKKKNDPIKQTCNNHSNNNESNNNHEYSKERFEVCVQTDRFKFTAAHFIAYDGYREKLHGHNYTVSLRLIGDKTIGEDGYLIDFGDVKKTVSQVCAELNEHFIYPNKSNVLIAKTFGSETKEHLEITCQDGTKFVFPLADCISLPIYHSSAEEIAWFLWNRVVCAFTVEKLLTRGIHTMQVTISEAPNQSATYINSVFHADQSPSFPPRKLRKCC